MQYPFHGQPGRLIVLDGAGGSGKDTQAERLVAQYPVDRKRGLEARAAVL